MSSLVHGLWGAGYAAFVEQVMPDEHAGPRTVLALVVGFACGAALAPVALSLAGAARTPRGRALFAPLVGGAHVGASAALTAIVMVLVAATHQGGYDGLLGPIVLAMRLLFVPIVTILDTWYVAIPLGLTAGGIHAAVVWRWPAAPKPSLPR